MGLLIFGYIHGHMYSWQLRLNIFIYIDILVLVSVFVVVAIISEWWLVLTTVGTSLWLYTYIMCITNQNMYVYMIQDFLCVAR